jgi:hypothetical protein
LLLGRALAVVVLFRAALLWPDADPGEADEAGLAERRLDLIWHELWGLDAQNVALVYLDLWRRVLRLELGVAPPIWILLHLGLLGALFLNGVVYRYRNRRVGRHVVILLLLLLLLLLVEDVWLEHHAVVWGLKIPLSILLLLLLLVILLPSHVIVHELIL